MELNKSGQVNIDNIKEENEVVDCNTSRNSASSSPRSRPSSSFSFTFDVFNGEDEGDQPIPTQNGSPDLDTDRLLTRKKGRKNCKRKREETSSPLKENCLTTLPVVPEVPSELEEEIERQLAEKASKANLTVVNVKNILKQILTNDRVLAMVRRSMDDVVGLDDEFLDDLPVPKLTRSKTKELLQKQPEIAWPITPTKWPVPEVSPECQVLIDQELPEDSSDEEYQPNEEDLMSISDFDLDSQPNTPLSASTPRPPSSFDCSTQTCSNWTDDGMFRIPLENIGQRTRSKLSLSDTALETIESMLVPPDITTDMYELDCDDDDWKDFLKQFAEPLRPSVNDTIDDDDEADPEYNLLADEDAEDVDKEELRMDRGVKVSKKELNQLMNELLDMYDDHVPNSRSPNHPLDPQHYVEVAEDASAIDFAMYNESPDDSDTALNDPLSNCGFSPEQRLLLDQQMRKHIQLLAQHFVQTHGHPELSDMASEFKDQLVSLHELAGNHTQSVFQGANLNSALKLVEDWEDVMNQPYAHRIKEFIRTEIHTSKMYWKAKKKYTCQFPPKMMTLVGKSKVVVYPLLLPPIPFRCDGFHQTFITLPENHLLAISLEQFLPFVNEKETHFKAKYHLTDSLLLVSKHVLPCYSLKVLISHVKKQRKLKGTKLNPIKYFFQHKKAPGTDHYVVAFDNRMLKPLSQQPPALMPAAWREHFFPGAHVSPIKVSLSENTKTLKPQPLYIPVSTYSGS